MTAILPAFRPRVVPDPIFSGTYQLSGTVKILGDPSNAPVYRRVCLHDQVSGRLMRVAWSDPSTGAYAFQGLPPGIYFVVSYDHTGVYGGVVETDVIPELMPGKEPSGQETLEWD